MMHHLEESFFVYPGAIEDGFLTRVFPGRTDSRDTARCGYERPVTLPLRSFIKYHREHFDKYDFGGSG